MRKVIVANQSVKMVKKNKENDNREKDGICIHWKYCFWKEDGWGDADGIICVINMNFTKKISNAKSRDKMKRH